MVQQSGWSGRPVVRTPILDYRIPNSGVSVTDYTPVARIRFCLLTIVACDSPQSESPLSNARWDLAFLLLFAGVSVWLGDPGRPMGGGCLLDFAKLVDDPEVVDGTRNRLAGRTFLRGEFRGRKVAIVGKRRTGTARASGGMLVVSMESRAAMTMDSHDFAGYRADREGGELALFALEAKLEFALRLQDGCLKAFWQPLSLFTSFRAASIRKSARACSRRCTPWSAPSSSLPERPAIHRRLRRWLRPSRWTLEALAVRRQRTDRAAMTGGAVDRTFRRRRFEVFHFSQLLVDHAVHSCHLAGGALLPLVVAREVLLDVAMSAAHTQGATVSPVHDAKKQPCRNCLQPRDLNVLENLFGRVVFAAFDPIGQLLEKPFVHVLILLRVRRSRD